MEEMFHLIANLPWCRLIGNMTKNRKEFVEFAVFDVCTKWLVLFGCAHAADRGQEWSRERESKGVAEGKGRVEGRGSSRNQILMSQSSFIANQPEINHSCKRAANRAVFVSKQQHLLLLLLLLYSLLNVSWGISPLNTSIRECALCVSAKECVNIYMYYVQFHWNAFLDQRNPLKTIRKSFEKVTSFMISSNQSKAIPFIA